MVLDRGESDFQNDSSVQEISYLFSEKNEVNRLIDVLSDGDPVDSIERTEQRRDEALTRLKQIFDRYLECPALLDTSIQSMVEQISQSLLKILHSSRGEASCPYLLKTRHLFSFLTALSKVRGRKVVMKLLPVCTDDLQTIWKATLTLSNQLNSFPSHDDTAVMNATTNTAPLWESVYMIWNWNEVLSLVPFDCNVVMEEGWADNFLETCVRHFDDPGPVREASSACIAAWLSRSDWEAVQLPSFVLWCRDAIIGFMDCQHSANSVTIYQVLAILQTLTALLKKSTISRKLLVSHLRPLQEPLLALSESSCINNLLLRKMLVKWWSRWACAHLPISIPDWRYCRGKRSLLCNLQQQAQSESPVEPENCAQTSEITIRNNDDEKASISILPPDVLNQVEYAIGHVMEAVSHSSTIVRWAAAKGLGRCAERLPVQAADDILDAILKNFEDAENDRCWHGACLAVAELARRGLLLPMRLDEVVPHLVCAVQYDVRRGNTSVGAHVRDAACYTYWAFCRSYSPAILRPYLEKLSQSIVLAALFDREVNCRRAASAAFQEAVGRQGANNFPHGIAILQAADYFSLGNRTNSFTSIAWQVATFEPYQKSILQHLYQIKLFHWDPIIRRLASRSLHGLTKLDPAFVGAVVVPDLMDKCLDPKNLHVRHGACLGVAETVWALSRLQSVTDFLSIENVTKLTALVSEIEKKRLFRGRGGEIMRSAVCRLVECLSKTKLPITIRNQVNLLDSVDANIPHPSEAIQESACLALSSLMDSYFPVGEKGPSTRLHKRVVERFTEKASTSPNPAISRGYALALGFLPSKLLAPNRDTLSSVLGCLEKTARHDSVPNGESDAETRRNSFLSLARIVETVGVGPSPVKANHPAVGLDSKNVNELFSSFLHGLEDYSTDRRGDVGSWCRMAAMQGLATLLVRVANSSVSEDEYFDAPISSKVVGALLKQISEKLDAVRRCAGDSLRRILVQQDPHVRHIRFRKELIESLGFHDLSSGTVRNDWADPSFAFPTVMNAASVGLNFYFVNILSGIVVSAGDLTENVSKSASYALLEWIKQDEASGRAAAIGNHLVVMMERNKGNGRVILPTLKVFDILFAHHYLDVLTKSSLAFAESCQTCLENEEEGCQDIRRLFALVDVTISLLTARPGNASVRKRALLFLCKMLTHPFPRVRSQTAQQFYMLLVGNSSFVNGDDDLVLEKLLNTHWSTSDKADLPDIAKEVTKLSIYLAPTDVQGRCKPNSVETADALVMKQ